MDPKLSYSYLSKQSKAKFVAKSAGYCVSALAAIFKVSPKRLQRFFQRNFRIGPKRWLSRFRESETKRLARSRARTKEISNSVGYAHPSSLCRAFKWRYGTSVKNFQSR